MKIFLLILLFLATSQPQDQSQTDFQKIEWLVGTWNRTNISKPGKTALERWEKTKPFELKGYGVTLQGTDTVFLEKITILVKDNSIYYVADVPENKQPVYFKFIKISNSGFECENPGHDFPKKITYQVDGNKLKAQISGNGKVIDYWFEKM
jgi:hypothetical protein